MKTALERPFRGHVSITHAMSSLAKYIRDAAAQIYALKPSFAKETNSLETLATMIPSA